MTLINPIYNISSTQVPAFKGERENVTTPIINPISPNNVAFKGTEALRAYNYNLVNKNNFNISTLKPLCLETDINKIEGEKIYNSAGDLVQIVAEKGDERIVYVPSPENKDFWDINI